MSLGEDARVTPRQNAARYLQFAESTKVSRGGKKKDVDERKSQDENGPFDGIEVSRGISLRGLGKTSAFGEWPAFREEKSRTQTKQGVLASYAPNVPRNKIAELFVLGGYGSSTSRAAVAGTRNKTRRGDDVGEDGGAGRRHRSAPETASGELASNKLHRLGSSTNADLVHAAVLNFKSLRKPERRSLDIVDDEMSSARGQNVSILHLREPADSWEPAITSFSDAGGSLRSAPKTASLGTGCGSRSPWNFSSRQSASARVGANLTFENGKRSAGCSSTNSVTVFLSRGVNSSSSFKSASRELSPVRWCDREVDGVYLGRSGWVQVQQHSLDESKKSFPNKGAVSLTSTLPNRMKVTRCRGNGRPGGEIATRKDRPRPDYLPLAVETRRDREDWGSPSPLQQELDYLSPTCTTPIISPPPAFQDPGSQEGMRPCLSSSKIVSGKPPLLSRSKAVADCDSPPGSPISLDHHSSGSAPRSKRATSSSASTPQTYALQNCQPACVQDRSDCGTRKNLFHRFVESSTSSSASSFVFRSLDGCASRPSAMPKLNETDSSGDGYEDEDAGDAYRRSCTRTKSPLRSSSHDRSSAEPASPNTFRYRSSQKIQTSKKAPSERNGAKFGATSSSSSSSSESCSSCDRKSPRTNFRKFGQKQNHDVQSNPWEVRNSRVRRSRSLQLPEKRSPGVPAAVAQTSPGGGSREHLSPNYPYRTNHKIGETKSDHDVHAGIPSGTHRTAPRFNGEATKASGRLRRFGPVKALSEEAKHEELKRESEEETRIITDYLNAARSRAAARDLLIHRFLNKPNEESSVRGTSAERAAQQNIPCGESGRRPSQKKAMQQRNADPCSRGHCPGNSSGCKQCSSSTCDFWPHCAHHREAVGQKKPSQPPTTKSPSNIKSSSPFYHKAKNLDRRTSENSRGEEKPEKEGQAAGARSSPAAAESSDSFEPQKDGRRQGVSVGRSFDELQQGRHRPHGQETKREAFRQGVEAGRGKCENAEVAKRRKDEPRRKAKYERHREGSSSTSSSSTAFDETGKSSGTRESLPPASIAIDEAASVNLKSSWEQEKKEARGTFSPRPGSAPTNETDEEPTALDVQRKSMSLPKSFLSEEYGRGRSGQSGLFPWRKQFLSAMAATPAPGAPRPQTPETPKTAPATPVRDAGNSNRDRERTKQMQYVRSSSTPLLDEAPKSLVSEWEPKKEPLQESATDESSSSKEINPSNNRKKEVPGQRGASGNQISESVLQKFKKSISLRFHKGQKGSAKDDADEMDHVPEEDAPDRHRRQPMGAQQKNEDGLPKEDGLLDQKHRLGSLVWRSGRERKKSKKAVRNAKCNSGDSGIQIENSLHLPGDSSESHDTDQQDELDSPPPMMRRRGPSTEKFSRPQSEVINQVLIDKFKADLQWRSRTRGCANRRVRRTNSDLGGQRLFNWELRNNCRRFTSLESPARGRTSRPSLKKSSPETSAPGRNRKLLYRTALRKSVSQPLGLNELSPLVRRKTSMVRNQILSEDEQDARGATSDDEALSDSESSVASLNDRKKSFEQAMDEEVVILAEAVWDHVAMEPEELAFRAGDVIEVLDTIDRDWWWGGAGDSYGWFPSAFVRLRVSQEDTVEDCLEAMASGAGTRNLRRRTSISLLSNDQVRSSVVRELLSTERDFVKVLKDVAEGYLAECRRRADMFSSMQIETIFSNIESLLSFQRKFLEDLEERVDKEAPHRSCVGETFLKHRSGFGIYSEYCNGHPMAIATLQELYQRSSYAKFFEACRLTRGLMEIPLDGYLLTPVQRICKYPLQLAELLKYTKLDHPDHLSVKEALETMREVAILINERKRRMESLEKLASWQQRVEGWEGEDLIEISTQLIYQGDVVRITSGMWTSNITMFLFDHQLVYCKKDLLKRNTYVYKGRIHTETSEIIDVPDGKDPHSGVTIRNGLKIYSCVRDKRLLICCRSGEEKSKWLEALAKERNLVAQDRESGLELPPAARQLARLAARSKRRPPNGPGGGKIYKRESHYNGYRMGRKMGTWFTFGGAKKSSRANLRTRNASRQAT